MEENEIVAAEIMSERGHDHENAKIITPNEKIMRMIQQKEEEEEVEEMMIYAVLVTNIILAIVRTDGDTVVLITEGASETWIGRATKKRKKEAMILKRSFKGWDRVVVNI